MTINIINFKISWLDNMPNNSLNFYGLHHCIAIYVIHTYYMYLRDKKETASYWHKLKFHNSANKNKGMRKSDRVCCNNWTNLRNKFKNHVECRLWSFELEILPRPTKVNWNLICFQSKLLLLKSSWKSFKCLICNQIN